MAHENWTLTYAGIELPIPERDGMRITLNPIDKAERNAAGDMMIEEVAMKRTVSVTWNEIKGDEANNIYSVMESNRTGKLHYFDVAKGGFSDLECYWGANPPITFNRYDDELEAQLYGSITVNFIEM
jgi:hypothetical protein